MILVEVVRLDASNQKRISLEISALRPVRLRDPHVPDDHARPLSLIRSISAHETGRARRATIGLIPRWDTRRRPGSSTPGSLDLEDFTDARAITATARVTRGDFRLLEQRLPQIEQGMKINDLTVITNDVIEAAQSTLVIGIS
jgi:hypothetical protein